MSFTVLDVLVIQRNNMRHLAISYSCYRWQPKLQQSQNNNSKESPSNGGIWRNATSLTYNSQTLETFLGAYRRTDKQSNMQQYYKAWAESVANSSTEGLSCIIKQNAKAFSLNAIVNVRREMILKKISRGTIRASDFKIYHKIALHSLHISTGLTS